MHRILNTLIELAAASIFIIPAFCIYNKLAVCNVKRTFLYIIFAFYLAAVLVLTGFPNIKNLTPNITINIIPFIGMKADFTNACLNILLFFPLGIFLPILWEKYQNLTKTLLTGLLFTCIIETAQLFTFRATDIDDIITNTLGTLIGYLTIKSITKNFSKYITTTREHKELLIVAGITISIMFFVQPFVSSLFWNLIF